MVATTPLRSDFESSQFHVGNVKKKANLNISIELLLAKERINKQYTQQI